MEYVQVCIDGARGDGRASLEKSLILRGFPGFLLEYEPVLLTKNNVN